jgi:hypothetical protein
LSAQAGEIVEEFDSPKLMPEIWEVRAVGGAFFEIKDGQLIMTSPGVQDGVLLLFVPEISGQDITIEFQLDVSQGDPSAQIWFGDEPLTPEVNTEVNLHWSFVQTVVNNMTYVKIEGNQKIIQDVPVNDGQNVYKFVFKGDKASFFVNGDEIDTVDKPNGVNFFHIGPDMYTSHYENRIGIVEYVKISGPGVKFLDVYYEGKLTGTWAEIKSKS